MQVIGQKHFVLLPPVAWAGVGERVLRGASYQRRVANPLEISPNLRSENGGTGFDIIEEEGDGVPFATWDPDSRVGPEDGNGTKYSRYVEPMRASLMEGDMLYLPSLWYIPLFLPSYPFLQQTPRSLWINRY